MRALRGSAAAALVLLALGMSSRALKDPVRRGGHIQHAPGQRLQFDGGGSRTPGEKAGLDLAGLRLGAHPRQARVGVDALDDFIQTGTSGVVSGGNPQANQGARAKRN